MSDDLQGPDGDPPSSASGELVASQSSSPLVVRSAVDPGLHYSEYKQPLRKDFIYTCSYCTLSEFEAEAIGFTIDHYEPRQARPELENEYSNLMYACAVCNQRKSDRTPPMEARNDGFRYFRPDSDLYTDHFEESGKRLKYKTPCGDFTIDTVDLNRMQLQNLRQWRQRLGQAADRVAAGIHALQKTRIDALPPDVRLRAKSAIDSALRQDQALAGQLEAVLREYARSNTLLTDDQQEDAVERERRLRALDQLKVTYPGRWHHRKPKSDKIS